MKSYLYLTICSPKERPLIEAESRVLLDTIPDSSGIVLCSRCVDVGHAAYLRNGMEVLFEGNSLDALLSYLDRAGWHREGFRVSVVKRTESSQPDSMQIAHEVGARIGGRPNLASPSCTFQVVLTDQSIWFGRVHTETDSRWVQHAKKPVVTSSSLPTRLARLMVNLGVRAGETLIDPCCGTGTIPIEAACAGVIAVGCDINDKMVRATERNLKYFSLTGEVFQADAREVQGDFDAVVTDLPYGRMLPMSSSLYREILSNLRHLASRHVIVTTLDLRPLLGELGYTLEQQLEASKSRFTRLIHVAGYYRA